MNYSILQSKILFLSALKRKFGMFLNAHIRVTDPWDLYPSQGYIICIKKGPFKVLVIVTPKNRNYDIKC